MTSDNNIVEVKTPEQIYQEFHNHTKILEDQVKQLRCSQMSNVSQGVKCDHILNYVGQRMLLYPDSEKMFEVICLLTKEPIEFSNCTFPCVEQDGTYHCALQAVVKRILKLALTANESIVHIIVKDVLFCCRQFPDFIPAFFGELNSRFPIAIPYIPSGFQAANHPANIARCGMLMGLMFSYCIDADDTEIYPYSRDQAFDGILEFMKKFICFIGTNPPESSLPYTFLLAYLKAVQTKLQMCRSRAEMFQFLEVLKTLAQKHKLQYPAADPTRRFIERFTSSVISKH